jgi:hypothetical protein
MVNMATPVKRNAEMKATRSPKLSIPMARAPRITVKLSHDRKVRSLAKKTLGSTRVGRAMRLPIDSVRNARHRCGNFSRGPRSYGDGYSYQEWSGEEAEKTWCSSAIRSSKVVGRY